MVITARQAGPGVRLQHEQAWFPDSKLKFTFRCPNHPGLLVFAVRSPTRCSADRDFSLLCPPSPGDPAAHTSGPACQSGATPASRKEVAPMSPYDIPDLENSIANSCPSVRIGAVPHRLRVFFLFVLRRNRITGRAKWRLIPEACVCRKVAAFQDCLFGVTARPGTIEPRGGKG
jgi:hypothetical protein